MEEIKFNVTVKELNGGVTTAEMTLDSSNEVAADVDSKGPEIPATDISSEGATEGQVLTADGQDGASWEDQSGSSSTYQPFSSSWTTDSTTAAFCEDLLADTAVVPAMAYMGEVSLNDMPLSGNAELVVEIMEGPSSGIGKSVHLILTSGSDSPYRWEYTYWKIGSTPHTSGWIGFQPQLTAGTGIDITSNTIKAIGLEVLITAPTSANTSGLKFVVLDSEPSTYYNGYYYIITE